MSIIQIDTLNRLRNYNYLIACEETGEAAVIDPLAVDVCLQIAQKNDWLITKIINTHEHWDHIEGNEKIRAATGAKVLAHHLAEGKIPNIDQKLHAADVISIGTEIKLTVLDTPGHTMAHICLLMQGAQPALFCGDTLFNAGCGNCHNGGDPELLFTTFEQQLRLLPDETLIYPGHDYLANNLGFAATREPSNVTVQSLLEQCKAGKIDSTFVTQFALEKEINPFLRLDNPEIIAQLQQDIPDFPAHPDRKSIFIALRSLRNKW